MTEWEAVWQAWQQLTGWERYLLVSWVVAGLSVEWWAHRTVTRWWRRWGQRKGWV